ncbi:MAG: glycoside hydrolase TIM-barrel-like domain-containing protein [Devosia sp.]
MATLALSLAGQVAGGALGGPIGATIGRALGALAGSAIDTAIFGEPARPGADIGLQGSSEGAPIPRLYGWCRLSGNIIWATDLEEIEEEGLGAKGGASERGIAASFAIGLCEGVVHRLGRIWADGQLLDTAGITLRFHRGTETQHADTAVEAVQADEAPGYRGLCYLVFERLPLAAFGNRIPNISVELCRVVGELEPAIKSVTVIPGATEFGYDPVARVRIVSPGVTLGENAHLARDVSDWSLSIDELVDLCPNLENVALVVAWFGDDLRCGECTIAPRVEAAERDVLDTEWEVAGISRGAARVVSSHDGGPAYGGTPSDAAVRAAIADLVARDIGVTLYPILLIDIPAGNPMGQPAYPWRGRISCDAGDDGTGDAVTQVETFAAAHREFILHYAEIAEEEGAEALMIGSELRGLTQVRGPGNSFPFVEALVELAGDVRAVVGPDMTLTYAADWSEYSGYQPGAGEKFFHLDAVWASDDIDVIGIDNYMPPADQREGPGPYDPAELADSIAGGEGFDWYFASDMDRTAGTRTAITDGAYGEPWVWRVKDIAAWWASAHHDRPGGVRSATATDWVAESKPIWFTELGCGAIHRGANQPNVFLDPKSSESFAPYFSNGAPDALMQRQFLRAQLDYWADSEMVERITLWTWDARPYPAFPSLTDVWADGSNHATGHWLTGRLGGVAGDELLRALGADYGVTFDVVEAATPFVHGYVVEAPMTLRQAMEPLLAVSGLMVRDGADGLSIGSPGAVLEVGEVVADGGPLLTRRRLDAGEAIGRVALSYWDRERTYLSGSVTAISDGAGALETASAALVLDIGGARLAAERLLGERNAQRETVELTLPPSRLALEVGDAIEVAGERFEVVEIRDGLARRVVARAVLPELDVAVVGERPSAVGEMPAARSLPVVSAAHLPPAPDDVGHTRLALGAFARPWPGEVSVTDEGTGAELAALGSRATLGTLTVPLAAGTTFIWDVVNAVELVLLSGHLASRDDAEVLAGANRIAVESDAGEWEIVGFANAELIAPKTYRLTRLLRGQGGTDHAMGTASVGNRVMLLDSRAELRAVDPAWLGATAELLCFAGPTDAVGVAAEAELGLAPILPLAPVHLLAVADGGDIALSWVRRSRADTDSWATEDAPLDWAPEAYRVEIYDGVTLVRTIDRAVPAATYTAAQQIADFGGPATSFTFKVAQVSALYGPGHWAIGEFDV